MATKLLEALIRAREFVVMDGGMGTSVEDRGVDVQNALWGSVPLLTAPGRALNDELHRAFADAGAELLIASTHNASRHSAERYLAERGLDGGDARLAEAVSSRPEAEQAEALFRFLNVEAVASARRALDGRALLVAGAIGGADRAYTTEARLSTAEAIERMRPQVELLAEQPIDLLLFEMISTRAEVEATAALVADLARQKPDLAVGVGFPCGEAGTTHAGVSMREATRILEARPPALVFIQCTRHDLVLRPLLELIEATGDPRRVGVYANDGRRWVDRCWAGERITPEAYAAVARTWADRGVAVIGGCCGTGPAHVAALAALRRPSNLDLA